MAYQVLFAPYLAHYVLMAHEPIAYVYFVYFLWGGGMNVNEIGMMSQLFERTLH